MRIVEELKSGAKICIVVIWYVSDTFHLYTIFSFFYF